MTRISLSTKVGNRFTWEEIVYDFAMPVLRTAKGNTSLPPFSIQLDEGSTTASPTQPALVSGVVQIGLTDAHLKHELETMIRNILLLTAFIIGAGALGAYLLTLRITKPLRSLAGVARQVAEGRSPVPLTPSTRDEVGQLTSMFNLMTHSLRGTEHRHCSEHGHHQTPGRSIDHVTSSQCGHRPDAGPEPDSQHRPAAPDRQSGIYADVFDAAAIANETRRMWPKSPGSRRTLRRQLAILICRSRTTAASKPTC